MHRFIEIVPKNIDATSITTSRHSYNQCLYKRIFTYPHARTLTSTLTPTHLAGELLQHGHTTALLSNRNPPNIVGAEGPLHSVAAGNCYRCCRLADAPHSTQPKQSQAATCACDALCVWIERGLLWERLLICTSHIILRYAHAYTRRGLHNLPTN